MSERCRMRERWSEKVVGKPDKTLHQGNSSQSIKTLFEVLHSKQRGRNLLGELTRFDCRKRNMREKKRMKQREEEERRRGELIYVGPNWIMISLSGEKLQWRAEHKGPNCLSMLVGGI